jgi:hypothetical protein
MAEAPEAKRRRIGLRLIPHWLAWPFCMLGLWYLLTRPLGGDDWGTYVFGVAGAIGFGAWSAFMYRVTVLERSGKAVVLQLQRRRKARPRRRLRWALGVLLVLAALDLVATMFLPTRETRAAAPPALHDSGPLPSIEGPSGESRVEPRFSHVASVIAGIGTEVRCWSVTDWRKREAEWGNWRNRPLGEWGAYTTRWRQPSIPHAYRIQLSPSICASLMRVAYEDVPVQKDPWPEALAWSVAALAHESQHARGIGNEAEAECYGVQSITATAEALGRAKAEGRFLAALYWQKGYVDQDPSEYRSKECREGGRLDLHPETDTWP